MFLFVLTHDVLLYAYGLSCKLHKNPVDCSQTALTRIGTGIREELFGGSLTSFVLQSNCVRQEVFYVSVNLRIGQHKSK
jgi:hypothetical protein